MARFFAAWSLAGTLAVATSADLNTLPAARQHVRYVDGVPMRFTSKLSRVVEMNFTLGFSHSIGRPIISSMLDKIAADYAQGGGNAFTVLRFAGPMWGSGLPVPMFTLADLLSSEVIVTNNVGWPNILPEKSPEAATAFETAVEIEGRGVLGFHGSAENSPDTSWSFYQNRLSPMNHLYHGNTFHVPVYKNDRESDHVALEDVFTTGTPMEVPMGVDSAGGQILKPGVIARMVRTESNNYSRDILTDKVFGTRTRCLLRFDPRPSSGLSPASKFSGGNAYAFLLPAGRGKSGFISAGHDGGELNSDAFGFDGGTGDFERFYAQMLFYFAGYRTERCGDAVDCAGLPLVDSAEHLTGKTYDGSGVSLDRRSAAFTVLGTQGYEARLIDLRGRTVAVRSGRENGRQEFDLAGLRAGLYFLRVKDANGSVKIQRYLVRGTNERQGRVATAISGSASDSRIPADPRRPN